MYKQIRIPIRPFPAVRVNWKWWRFIPRAIEYHEKSKALRLSANMNINTIRKAMNEWSYEIIFYFAIPKTKQKMNLDQMPYDIRPDIDNLFKAFTDSIFFWKTEDDKWIWKLNATKRYGIKDEIVFCYQD